jgi:hypothetical protein
MNDDHRVLDLRTYRLTPGGGERFDRIFREDVLPLLAAFEIEVAAHGTSRDDPESYYLVRTFASAAERNSRLEAFYGSDEWRGRHRDRVLELIESYHVLLLSAQDLALR